MWNNLVIIMCKLALSVLTLISWCIPGYEKIALKHQCEETARKWLVALVMTKKNSEHMRVMMSTANEQNLSTNVHRYSAQRRNADRCFKGDACKNPMCFRMHPRDVSAELCRYGEQCKFHNNPKLMCNKSHSSDASAPFTH
jgi:hypothetical protein